MEIFSILELVAIFFIVGWLVYYYAQKKVGWHIKGLTYLSWILSFVFVFLVPLDIYFTFQVFDDPYGTLQEDQNSKALLMQNVTQSAQFPYDLGKNNSIYQSQIYESVDTENLTDSLGENLLNFIDKRILKDGEEAKPAVSDQEKDKNGDNPQNSKANSKNYKKYLGYYQELEIIWKVIWWICFFMTWIILPFFQEYEDAGDFTILGKAKTSIKLNLKLYGFMILLGVIFIIYLLISGTLTVDKLGGFAIVMVNCFGLLLVVLLLGHGIVALPKKYWLEKNNDVMLKYLYFQASQIENDIMEVQYKLEEEVKYLQLTIQKHSSHPDIQHLLEIQNIIPDHIMKSAQEIRGKTSISTNLDDKKIIKIHKNIKGLFCKYDRIQSKRDNNFDQAFKQEDIIKAQGNPLQVIQGVFWEQREGKIGILIDKIVWVWYTKIQKFAFIFFALLFAAFSISILLSQLSVFTDMKINVFDFLVSPKASYWETQLVIFIPLTYITFCVYYGLFHMKIGGLFGFYKNHHTDGTSLMFGSINFLRVSAPICYNFLKIIDIQKSAFNSVMGQLDIFSMVNVVFPILLIILSCFNAFDIYKKIMSIFGFTQFSFSSDFSDEGIDDGRKIIQRARLMKEKEFLSLKPQLKLNKGFNSVSKMEVQERDEKSGKISQRGNNLSSSLTSNSQHGTQNDIEHPPFNYGGNQQGNYLFNKNKNYNDILNI